MTFRGRFNGRPRICEYATCEHKIHVRSFKCADDILAINTLKREQRKIPVR